MFLDLLEIILIRIEPKPEHAPERGSSGLALFAADC